MRARLVYSVPVVPFRTVPSPRARFEVRLAAGPAGWSVWSPLRSPHLMVSGATGSGKSSAVAALLAGLPYMPRSFWRVVVIDGKGGLDFEGLRRHTGVRVVNLDGAAEAAAELGRECRSRMETLRQAQVANWVEYLHTDHIIPMFPTLVVIDEAADVFGGYGLSKADAEQVRQGLGLLLRQGRAAGLFVVASFLRPDVEAWGGMGGLLREQLHARLHLGPLSSEAGRMFGALEDRFGPSPIRSGYGYALNLNGPRYLNAVPVRVPLVSQSDAVAHLQSVMFPGDRPEYPRLTSERLPTSTPTTSEGRP